MVFLFLISSELLMFNKGGHTVIESRQPLLCVTFLTRVSSCVEVLGAGCWVSSCVEVLGAFPSDHLRAAARCNI